MSTPSCSAWPPIHAVSSERDIRKFPQLSRDLGKKICGISILFLSFSRIENQSYTTDVLIGESISFQLGNISSKALEIKQFPLNIWDPTAAPFSRTQTEISFPLY